MSSAVRSTLAGHQLRGIAELSKQRYRVANRRRNVCRLTSHSSGRLRRRLIPALGVRTASLCSCLAHCLFGFACASRSVLFRAGLRRCLSCAWWFAVSCARCCISSFRASRRARFVATLCLSSAVRSSHAGRKFRGIAGHLKRRYRVRKGWRSVLASNISFKADGFAAA